MRCGGDRRARLGVDAHDHGHAGPQQRLLRDLGRNQDAHGQALHDLGEVAGGVVRRQQREHRAGRRREARHSAFQLAARQGIDADRHRLTLANLGELRFLEVGIDIDGVQRHQAGETLGRLHIVADLHGAIADHAVERALE